MRTFTTYLIATAVFVAGSWVAPWVIVPVIAALLVLAAPRRFTPFRLTIAAAAAWGGILAWSALRAPVGTLAGEVAGIVHAPAWVLIGLTPAIAALLAWGGAGMASLVRQRARRPAPDA